MKGFPNQVAELPKHADGLNVLRQLVEARVDAKDDGRFGEAIIRAGIRGTDRYGTDVEAYLRRQVTKPTSNQSFRTTARGLRELYRLLRLIDDSGPRLELTPAGQEAAAFAGRPMDAEQIRFWRRVIQSMTHTDSGATSHPYQVLLRLVARKPGITRAKCALALEARDDSEEELNRIVALADLSESAICTTLGITKANWDNAKKILPRFAEQLGDVVKIGEMFVLADAPGHAPEGEVPETEEEADAEQQPARPRAPRSSRNVTATTIGTAGTAEGFDEVVVQPMVDPEAAANGTRLRRERLSRHNHLVRRLAARLQNASADLYEDPFDILALIDELGLLVEVKTLNGEPDDERSRVQEALAQLLYYAAFVAPTVAGAAHLRRVACFEREITPEHRSFLNSHNIGVIWADGEQFKGDGLARDFLGRYIEELR